MTITKLTFQQTFPTGLYMNQKLGMEIDITPQDDIQGVFIHAKNTVEEIFKAMNPHVGEVHTYSTIPPYFSPEKVDPIVDEEISARFEETKNKIRSAKTLEEKEAILSLSEFKFNLELKAIVRGDA